MFRGIWYQSEMNVFVPQSIQTMMELEEIADVKRQIISPRFSTPIIGIVQDGVLGSYNLTSPTMKIDWKDAMNIISYTSIDDFTSIKKNTDVKGSDFFSLIVPNKINISTNDFEIENGQIIKGHISKAHIGAKKQNSLIHLIWDEYGMHQTKNFIDDVQKLVNNFNMLNGFSCGIGDLEIPKEVTTELTKFFETKKLEVKHMITEMENNPDLLDQDTFEETLYNNLNNIREEASKMVMKNLKLDNNFYIMIFSGAKGEPINMGQMLGCIGQQAVEGTRIKKNVNGRTLQYFHKDDDTALARGFVEQSFLKGMHPLSFIFHNMGSREGLIDTAIKSVTGDTPIFVLESGSVKHVNIGDWIDTQLDDDNNKPKVKHYVDRDMELLDLENIVYIPTTDEDGKVTWSIVSAITRHDPGKELYEIKTKGGRKVIVTESKSLLIWVDNKFVRMSTPEVRVGDFVPVTQKLCEPPVVNNSNTDDNNLDNLVNASNKCVNKFLSGYIVNHMIEEQDQIIIECTKDNRDHILTLLSRIGVYGNIEENNIIISDMWIGFLKRQLNVPDSTFKICDVPVLEWTTKIQNDVILDEIVEINIVDVARYPKVYDLTVPDTLNFGLANGLHVVDTAESGYMQRKLIKSMEDAMIKYDLTVRNANNTVIQFIYGDGGIDTTKQYEYTSKILELGNTEVLRRYKFTDDELKGHPEFSKKQNEEYSQNMIKMRNHIRDISIKTGLNRIVLNKKFMLPINYFRIMNNNNKIKTGNTKLTVDYILKKLDEISSSSSTLLMCMNKQELANKNSIKNIDEQIAKTLFKFSLHENLAPKICIYDKKYSKEQFDIICKDIVDSFNNHVVSVGEMIGTIAAQSLGEPLTQMTLNSVDWEEEIIISDNGFFKVVKIGDFTDNLIEANLDKVEHVGDIKDKEMGDTYYLDIKDKGIKAISVSKDGKVSWNLIEAVTKHLPMNTDGTSDLVKITTEMGRTATATKAKSFLTRINNEIVPIRGDELKVGTYLPLITEIPEGGIKVMDVLDLEPWFPKKEYKYTDEITKAVEGARMHNRPVDKETWYRNQNGKSFTLPYTKYSSIEKALEKDPGLLIPGIFLPTFCKIPSRLPVKMPLDADFGFFVGAFLAEGCTSETQAMISNNDADYRKKIEVFCDKYGIGHHTVIAKDKNEKGWTSSDFIIHSKPLAEFMRAECGRLSHNKCVPDWVYNANDTFLKALIDGYFSGDGSVNKNLSITAGTVSQKLADGILRILLKFGVMAKKSKGKMPTKNNRGTTVFQQPYSLYIGNIHAKKFAETFNLVIKYKQERLEQIKTYKYTKYKYDVVPGNNLTGLTGDVHKNDIKTKATKIKSKGEKKILENCLNSKVQYDRVKTIDIIQPTKTYVYDLTIKNDLTFVLGTGLCAADTFHSVLSKKDI